jgi:hypothetical protein
MWQGAQMGVPRAFLNAMALSGYQGRRMKEVLEKIDLSAAVTTDIRTEIGKIIFGKNVIYPEQNPTPPVSSFRKGLASPENFIKTIKDKGIEVIPSNTSS